MWSQNRQGIFVALTEIMTLPPTRSRQSIRAYMSNAIRLRLYICTSMQTSSSPQLITTFQKQAFHGSSESLSTCRTRMLNNHPAHLQTFLTLQRKQPLPYERPPEILYFRSNQRIYLTFSNGDAHLKLSPLLTLLNPILIRKGLSDSLAQQIAPRR